MQTNPYPIPSKTELVAGSQKSSKPKRKSDQIEKAVEIIFFLIGMICVALVLLISIYLIAAGLPAIQKIGLIPFLTGTTWKPGAAVPEFGILPFILSSVYGMAGALIAGVPIGILAALYLAKGAKGKTKKVLSALIQLLAGIPSVVYGLVGMLVIVPAVRSIFHLSDGACLFSAIIVLSIMILPTVISMSLGAIESLPKAQEEGSLALGATSEETLIKVVLPAASDGIAAAVVLGAGRVIGEAVAVMMVAGNASNMPGLFESVRFLTTAVSSEMSYASGLQLQALFSIALVLFAFIMMLNVLLNHILKRKKGAC